MEMMNRITTTITTATKTSDRTCCFFRSLSQSSVNFGCLTKPQPFSTERGAVALRFDQIAECLFKQGGTLPAVRATVPVAALAATGFQRPVYDLYTQRDIEGR
jgi:hypothetical protein